jgi:hypothetical protein
MQFARVAYWPGPGYVDVKVQPLPTIQKVGTCSYSTEFRQEMDYGTVSKYTLRALSVYEHIFGYAVTLGRHPRAQEYLNEVQWATVPCIDDDSRRRVLARAIEYDRVVLGLDPDIVRREIDCAIWASDLEGAKNKYRRTKLGDEVGDSGATFRIPTNAP